MIESIIDSLTIWAPPIIILVLGLLVGWFFKRIIAKRLARLVSKTSWRGDDVILNAAKSHIILWCFLAAFHIASSGIHLANPYNEYLATLILAILILSVTMVIANVLVGLLNIWAEKQESGFPSTAIFTNLIRITIIAIGALIVLQTMHISIAPVLTAFGVGGLAVSLALKDTLSDLLSGLHILLSRKVKLGDFVQLDSGEMGYVTNITWRNTSLVERANNVISIPNSRLSTAIVRNYDTRESSFSIRVPVGVAYDSDLSHVEAVTLDVARSVVADVEGSDTEFDPLVRYKAFGDSSIDFIVYFRGKQYGDHHPIIHEFIKRLHKRFGEEGIEIPFPIRTIVQKS